MLKYLKDRKPLQTLNKKRNRAKLYISYKFKCISKIQKYLKVVNVSKRHFPAGFLHLKQHLTPGSTPINTSFLSLTAHHKQYTLSHPVQAYAGYNKWWIIKENQLRVSCCCQKWRQLTKLAARRNKVKVFNLLRSAASQLLSAFRCRKWRVASRRVVADFRFQSPARLINEPQRDNSSSSSCYSSWAGANPRKSPEENKSRPSPAASNLLSHSLPNCLGFLEEWNVWKGTCCTQIKILNNFA